MGGALFLSERFHERLHDGGKKFPARSCEVRAGECSRSRCARGHAAIAQGVSRERRTQFQIAGRPRREALDRIWGGRGLPRNSPCSAEDTPPTSEGRPPE